MKRKMINRFVAGGLARLAACALLSLAGVWSAWADEWLDPDTGITWTYTVFDGKASLGSGGYYGDRAVPTSTTGAITIPSALGGYPVTSIGVGAFSDCSGLTSVTMPAGVTSIREFAFRDCSRLTSVVIPEGVTEIGGEAFACCSQLVSILLPDTIKSIGWCSFYGCPFKRIEIPQGVNSIALQAFDNCTNLIDVVLASNVISIGRAAFGQCTSLGEIVIPSSVTNIQGGVFGGCESLTNVTFEGNAPSTEEVYGIFSALYDFGNSANEDCTVYVHDGSSGWGVDIPGEWHGVAIKYIESVSGHSPVSVLDLDPALMQVGGCVHGSNLVCVAQGETIRIDCHSVDEYGVVEQDGNGEIFLVLAKDYQHQDFFYGDRSEIISILGMKCGTNTTSLTWTANVAPGRYQIGVVGSWWLGWEGNTNSIPEYAYVHSRTIFVGTPHWEMVDGIYYEYTTDGSGATITLIGCDGDACTNFWNQADGVRETLTLPSTLGGLRVKSIGDCAWGFWGSMYSLDKIVVPEGVESIGAYALASGCYGTIVLPSSLRSVGAFSLGGCMNSPAERLDFYCDVPDGDATFLDLLGWRYPDADWTKDVYVLHRYSDNWAAFLAQRGLAITGYLDSEPEPQTHTVVFNTGSHGTLTGAVEQVVADGGTAYVPDVMPNSGYSFFGWDGDVTAPITSNAVFTAQYAPIQYGIAYLDVRGASNANPTNYNVESRIDFEPLADVEGWWFTGWEPSFIPTGTVGNVTVTAQWTRAKVSVNAGGAASEYDYGDTVTFTSPAPFETNGMQIVTLGTTFTSPVVTNQFTVTVTNDISFAWDILATNWWLEVEHSANGAIESCNANPVSVPGWIADGETVALAAVPTDHFLFVRWTGDVEDCVETNGLLLVTMDRPRTIGAEFAVDTFTVTFLSGEHGIGTSITLLIPYGERVADVPYFVPEAGYEFVGWDGDIGETVIGDATFTANWRRISFDVTVDGVVETYNYGETVTFTAPAPFETNGIQVVTLGATFTSPVVTNEFAMTVTNDISFAWDIMATNWWLEVERPTNGVVEIRNAEPVSVPGWVGDESFVMLAPVPVDHYHFTGWTGDTEGCREETNGWLFVTMDRPRTIGAKFEIDDISLGEAVNASALEWTTSGDDAWVGVWSAAAADGVHAARSGAIGDNEETRLAVALEGAGTLSFDWRASCEEKYDAVRLEVDGELVRVLSGETGWTNVVIELGFGEHEISWIYMKGRSKSAGEDAVWLDNVVWTEVPLPTLADALGDFKWETDGSAFWTAIRSGYSFEGDSMAIAETPGDLGESVLRTTVSGAGRIVFRWAVFCEEYYDWLYFAVDGEVMEMTTGETDWETVNVDLGDGEHVLEWIYWKDEIDEEGLVGADCAMLDWVQWYPKGGEPPDVNDQSLDEFFAWLKEYHQIPENGGRELAQAAIAERRCAFGKSATLYEEFVAKTNPENIDDVFKAKIEFVDDSPVVTPDPYYPELRKYTTLGKKSLDDPTEEWVEVKDGEENNYNFFKVTVEMK